MARKSSTAINIAAGAVVTGLVAGAGYGGCRLHRWSQQWDQAAEHAASYASPAAPVIAPELLSWHEVGRVQTGLASVKSFVLLNDGSIAVAGERKLRVITPAGQVIRDIALGGMPQAVTAVQDSSGTLLFAGLKDHVEVFDLSGAPRGVWPSLGEGSFITCLTGGAGGKSLWVADAGRRVVSELDMSGTVLREIGREDVNKHSPGLVVPSAHLDVAVAADGLVWINNPGRHELEAYDAQGIMVRQWGLAGEGVAQFTGCCNPTDFFLMGDRVITAEKGTPRVKVYDGSGSLLSVVATDFAPNAAGIDVAADSAGKVWALDPVGHDLRIYAANKPGLAGVP
jgi:DNA-binding beta-propeller fold protein YncE